MMQKPLTDIMQTNSYAMIVPYICNLAHLALKKVCVCVIYINKYIYTHFTKYIISLFSLVFLI